MSTDQKMFLRRTSAGLICVLALAATAAAQPDAARTATPPPAQAAAASGASGEPVADPRVIAAAKMLGSLWRPIVSIPLGTSDAGYRAACDGAEAEAAEIAAQVAANKGPAGRSVRSNRGLLIVNLPTMEGAVLLTPNTQLDWLHTGTTALLPQDLNRGRFILQQDEGASAGIQLGASNNRPVMMVSRGDREPLSFVACIKA